MGLEDGSRKVGLLCVHWNGGTVIRHTPVPTSARVLPSRMRTKGGCICAFSQISQYGDVSMCVIPLMSVSEHVFRGKGI